MSHPGRRASFLQLPSPKHFILCTLQFVQNISQCCRILCIYLYRHVYVYLKISVCVLFPARFVALYFWVVLYFFVSPTYNSWHTFGMQFHFPLTAEFAIRLIYHLFMSSDKFNLIAKCKALRPVGGEASLHFKCDFWNGQTRVFHNNPRLVLCSCVRCPVSFWLSHSNIINVNGLAAF